MHWVSTSLFWGIWFPASASTSNSLNTSINYFSLLETELLAPEGTSVIFVECILLFLTDKDVIPKTLNDVKLINAGRILENNKTLAESRVPVGEVPGGVITMHVVVRPPQSDKSEKHLSNSPKQNRCGCTILWRRFIPHCVFCILVPCSESLQVGPNDWFLEA